MIRHILPAIAAVLLLACASAGAAEPRAQLEATVNTVLSTLNDGSLNKDQKIEKIHAAAKQRFDLELMAKLVVGRDHWAKFSAEQRAQYVSLFESLLLASYSEQIDSYAGERIEFGATRLPKDTRAEVDTTLVSKSQETPVTYLMHLDDGNWLVYDVQIDGVSIRTTYYNQYTSYLTRHSVDDFLKLLREKMAGN